MTILEIVDLSINFGGLKAVDSLSFAVNEGQIFGLIGPNGAGKTTVFNCITRYYQPNQGRIVFGGQNILDIRSHDVIGKGIARTFQNMELFKSMTVLDNLLVGQHCHLDTNVFSEALSLPVKKRKEREISEKAQKVMELLGLSKYARDLVLSLPYGMQKMVEMGRALVSEPKLILLDEPAAGMNPSESKELSSLIKRLRDTRGITVLVVEHDMAMVRSICDEICVMDFGRKIAQGSADEICRNPQVIEAYLGCEEEGSGCFR
ncbi:ABC transporter ATP-binding protein [Candidatus Formimonas warabiya]|uniref:ABC transporter ATP-binding protein n=1 Tax=Formimonas warabiya TaxID=1761012 RepID=A0A3G1KQL0_FORW1|nr:ABC transporter ATP-binding protein [Candidatus Formimonas warabiya]ATW24738.1 ABC transporter ATP-binding protein [Candidatus Formimonas warabiya]